MIRTQIQLTEEQVKTLKKIANKKQVSLAELIRQGVNALMRLSGEVSIEERKKRAIVAAGCFHSGKQNISAKHDEYLTEAFRS
ncbi:MAG: ribbon-helix-helix protein, CopG family [Candidatus Mariimomonas ferrooxydans]